ncbi:hypothetical protein, partial [Thermosulfurimonas dismutans]|uniref:hypothetical protein n=1 Tax=Thermosulfurimonas dismutans TaxID=999894 RepID=UPI001ABFAAEF
ETKDFSWEFYTRSLEFPYYRIDAFDIELPVRSGQTYAFYFVPANGTDLIRSYRYRYPSGVSVSADFYRFKHFENFSKWNTGRDGFFRAF